MGRYDAQQIVGNIERLLNHGPETAEQENERDNGMDSPCPASIPMPPTLRVFEESVLPPLGENCAVDKVSPGGRLTFLKRVWLRLLRPLAGPQAVVNAQTLRGFEILANHLDLMQKRFIATEDLLTEVRTVTENLQSTTSQHLESIDSQLEALREKDEWLVTEIQQGHDKFFEALATAKEEAAEQRAATDQAIDAEQSTREAQIRERFEQAEALVAAAREAATNQATAVSDRYMWVDESYKSLEKRIGEMEGALRDASAKLLQATEYRSMVNDLIKRAATSAPVTPAPTPQPEPAGSLEQELGARELDLAYFRFQRQFRGDEKILRERQEKYVGIIRNHVGAMERPRLLDLACGDGVFIDIARNAGFNARGVDVNSSMVRLARERDVPVENADALKHLAAQPDESWDVITAFQFIEHLPPDALMTLLREVRRVLRTNGVLVLETLNPNTFMAMKWFHFDLSHERLVFPQVLELLMETAGLTAAEWKGINPVDERDRLVIPPDTPARESFEKLNSLLFGPQDYYMVGVRKTASHS